MWLQYLTSLNAKGTQKNVVWWDIFYLLKPLSVTSNSLSSRTATAGNVGAAIVAHVARSAAAVREPTLFLATERILSKIYLENSTHFRNIIRVSFSIKNVIINHRKNKWTFDEIVTIKIPSINDVSFPSFWPCKSWTENTILGIFWQGIFY